MESQETIRQLMQDLEIVKSAVRRNRAILRDVFAPAHYRFLLLYTATAITLVSLLFEYCIAQFGSFHAIPSTVKLLLYVVIAVLTVSGSLLKFVSMNRSARRIDASLTIWTIFRDYLIPYLFHLYLPLAVLSGVVIVYCAISGHALYIIGVLAIFIGLMMNVVALHAEIVEYYVLGYWLIVSGIASMIVPGVSGGVWTALCFGGGMYAFQIVSAVQSGRSSAHSRRG